MKKAQEIASTKPQRAARLRSEQTMKKVLLVARDTAPSEALKLLSHVLTWERNLDGALESPIYEPQGFLAGGKDFSVTLPEILSHVADCDAVVVGMSSSEELAKEELAVARETIRLGKPVFCYADTFGLRPYFKDVLEASGTTLFHLNDYEVQEAVKKHPTLDAVSTGNPMWETYFFPKSTREQVRESLGISNDAKVILCPGGKDVAVNILHFSKAIEDAQCLKKHQVVVILSLHGGDRTDPAAYNTLKDYTPEGVTVKIVSGKDMSGSDILPGVDLVCASASTIEIEAICQRIPVVSYISNLARRRLKKATGSDVWELVTQRVVLDANDGEDEVNPIGFGLHFDSTMSRRVELYPKPKHPGTALTKMFLPIRAKIG